MEQKDTAGTIEKALDVLFYLHEAPEPQGVTAIGRALGMPKSSTHRLLSALGKRGLVEQDARGRYHVGIGLVALGLGALEREPVAVAARPVLEARALEVGETFFLVVARAGRLLVLDKAEGSGFLRAAPRLGSTVPVHATAVGKLYLAFAPELLRKPENTLERFTDNTTTDQAELAASVEAARRDGWASNLEEWIPGLSVLAAPIRPAGRMVGTVALAAAAPRVNELGIDYLAHCVVDAADSIAARLRGVVR